MLTPLAFATIPEYLQAVRVHSRPRPLTLEVFARKIDYRSPRTIAMVLKGQRSPSLEMIERIAKWQKLAPHEHEYLQLLTKRNAKKNSVDLVRDLDQRLEEIRAMEEPPQVIREDLFRLVSDWYHLPLRQFAESPRFREDPQWISRAMKDKVSAADIGAALERLLKLELLVRDSRSGRLKKPDDKIHRVKSAVTTKAIQDFHFGMLDRAKESLVEDLMMDREFNSSAFRTSRERLPEIKAYLRKVHAEIIQRFSEDQADDVFQFGSQFFRHTR